MDARLALAVYLLIAAAAGFVTASANLPVGLRLGVIIALGVVAVLVRRQVLGLGGFTRVAVAFLGVYLLSFFLTVLLLR
ncbi:MAG TPA: hypothetical protein VFO05_00065 [Candidatus Limnocylindrales bacterium]|nr:hypothetical protein [Candidatus Limnocylindrales bacterium]